MVSLLENATAIDVPVGVVSGVEDVTPAATPPAGYDTSPTKIQITLDRWKQCKPFYLTDKEMGNIDRDAHFLPLAINSAVLALAEYINADLLSLYKGVYGYTGTAGTTPFASDVTGATNLRKTLVEDIGS